MRSTMDLARGRWVGILQQFGIPAFHLTGRQTPCPLCGGKDRFRFDDKAGNGTFYCNQCGSGNGMDLLKRWKDWDFRTAAQEVDKVVGEVPQNVITMPRSPADSLRRVIDQCGPVSLPVRAYLANRGLRPTKNLRSAVLPYYDGGRVIGHYDTMVASIVNASGGLESLHLTYVRDAKKADVPSPRKVMSPITTINGCAIRLTKRYEEIGIAEGIETAIAVMLQHDIPCWSVVSAGQMETFIPPAGIKSVRIFGDADHSFAGQKAAYVLANRLVGAMKVSVELPEIGMDYADKLEAANAG